MARKTSSRLHSELQSRQESAIAHGALTNSKRPECFVRGVYPTHFSRQQGCYSWDTKGNKYIDFLSALGTSILGFNNEEVNQAIITQIRDGITFSLATELEVKTAEKVKEFFPFVEKVRFLKTGTDACQAAVRIARGYTGNSTIYSEGYHGWGDEFVGLTAPAVGIPQTNVTNITAATYPPAGTAALIVEPVQLDSSQKRIDELRAMRARCTETSTLLIYDEVITGFRYSKYGVCNSSGITPDILCLGKAIANGMPLSVVAGKTKVMEGSDYFVSSTFAGDTLSLAAAYKTMSLLQTKFDLNHLWDKGSEFLFRFNQIWPEGVWLKGYPTRAAFEGDDLTRALFCQEAIKAGIFFHPKTFFFNFSHIEVMDSVLSSCSSILGRIKTGSITLEGEIPKTAFAERSRKQ